MGRARIILGLESSCDETAAAVVEADDLSTSPPTVLSNVIATQHNLHERYGGVVPEIASRAHLERITPVIRQAQQQAGVTLTELHAIAVGHRPGLIGSLLVGVAAAKALAWSLAIPLIGVDHVAAHLHACLLAPPFVPPPVYPALGLVVSGGHSSIFHLKSALEMQLIGRTIDDAAGEAFDKGAAILGLGYPGGPAIDRLARTGNPRAHAFPTAPHTDHPLNMSFSGLKTALLYAVRGNPQGRGAAAHFTRSANDLSQQQKADYAASFEHAVVEVLMKRLERAMSAQSAPGSAGASWPSRHDHALPTTRSSSPYRSLLVGGGVSANTQLRSTLRDFAESFDLDLRLPPMPYCLDNAAMIAGYAHHRLAAGGFDALSLRAEPQSSFTVARSLDASMP